MESSGYKMVQIKTEKECDIFDEVAERSGVKKGPLHSGDYDVSYIEDVGFSDASTIQCKSEQVNSETDFDNQYGDVKIEIVEHVPGKCELYDSSGVDNVDQRVEYCKFEEQKEETYVAVGRNIEDVDFTDASTIQCEAEQVNSETDFDNQYGDVKIKIVEHVPGKCELYDSSGVENVDQKVQYCKFEEQKEETYVAVRRNIENVDFTDASTIQCEAEQVNSETDFDNQYGDVKIEIVEHVPGKCELYDSSGVDNVDQRVEYCKFEEQKEETHVAVRRNIEDVDFTDASTIQCEAEQVNSETDFDNQYGDVKIEIVEHVPGKCELYDSSGVENVDQKVEYCKFEEQKEETYVAVRRNIENVDFTDASISQCEAEQVNNLKRSHTGQRPFLCKICSKVFTHLSYLKAHEKIHTGVKPYICKVCSKAFTRADDLKAHERIHTGEKPFLCKVCSKAFTQSSNLKTHERIHTIAKSFHCKFCSKAFARSDVMTAHERTHTQGKSFLCKFCSKVFTHSSNLKAHEKIHTGVRPFLCKVCSKAFTRSDDLKAHERIHTGEKPFLCKVCSKAFAQSSNLKTHERCHTRA